MKQKSTISILIVIFVIVAGIGLFTVDFNTDDNINVGKIDSKDDSKISFGNISSYNEAVNAFSYNFFKKLNDDSDDDANIFYSPYSVFVALAMTYEGAKGQTADEMESVLNIEQDNDSFHQYMQSLYEYLNYHEKYDISTANALWVKENLPLLEEYLNVIQTYYGGTVNVTDFSNPDQAAEIINQWVEDNTNGLIKDLIQSSMIDPIYTALILTNAIYFKGLWDVQFDPENTTDRGFKVSQDTFVDIPTMQLIETKDIFNYTETDELQILELPYSGDELSMIIFLPKDNIDLSDVINSIDNDQLTNWKDSMTENELDIYLPKFKFETSYGLNDYLKELGMQEAFASSADFSGITGGKDLFISSVVHKAFIEINEEGTEAAAATAVIMSYTSVNGGGPTRIIFDADHPFLFLIQHKETDTILFMGKVSNPSE